jgi:hypothetical protein
MITSSEEYRQYAEECFRWARETPDEAQQQLFLEMARVWAQAASLQDGQLPTAPAPLAAMSPSPKH